MIFFVTKVQPCLAILDKNFDYIFLTCSNHHNGSKLYVIHPPRKPTAHILPTPISDQLCHAIIQSRTFKPLKSTKYSSQFQMHKQRGMFCDIDACSLTNFGMHDFTSFLISQIESYTIAHHLDINYLLSQIVHEKQLSSCIVNAKREEAKVQNAGVDFDSSINGATYVPTNVAIKFEQVLQKNIQSDTVIVDNRANDEQEYNLHFK